MLNISPTIRISMGLMLIVLSIIIISDMAGMIPDRDSAVIEGRKAMSESIAIQYSLSAQRNDFNAIALSMKALVKKNDDLLSAALRTSDGKVVAITDGHENNWKAIKGDKSTPTHIQVPIFNSFLKNRQWGKLELHFAPLNKAVFMGFPVTPLLTMLAFVAFSGFIAFLLITRIIFKRLDPSSVIPARVRNALDAFTEGVIITDEKNRIILANEAFSEYTGISKEKLSGVNASTLNWTSEDCSEEFPWEISTRTRETLAGTQLSLGRESGESKTFVINSSPIKDEEGSLRGVMTTFDDVTLIESKNSELESMLTNLKESRSKISSQNRKLKVLATRDPLTDCLNRRTLFDEYGALYDKIKSGDAEFSCIMTDIDYFKSVNDKYGHTAGDEVLKSIAAYIKSFIRDGDALIRYGGEEFCIVLPGASIENAKGLAERARTRIESTGITATPGGKELFVTASFGVSSAKSGAQSLQQLIDQADNALYVSKNNGRNRVSCWSEEDSASPATAVAQSDGTSSGTGPFTATESGSTAPDGYDPHDNLTGLPNRTHFKKSLHEVVEYSRSRGLHAAVVILNIDMFKRINNALGYSTGDYILKLVAENLIKSLRTTDRVGRFDDGTRKNAIYGLGGDEFGILLTDLESTEHVGKIIERITNTIANPVVINGHEIHLTCSTGISLFPGDGDQVDTLLTNAGISLRQAKSSGHNSYRFFDESYSKSVHKDYQLENELRAAIENNEFELYYQPQLDLTSMRISSLEALIRWHHPEKGMVPPNEFIPIAESSGLIAPIGQWVLHTASAQAKQWNDAGHDVTVAVNLSALQFSQKDLVEKIRFAVDKGGASSRHIELEITESTIMENIETASKTMQALHDEGYTISIDDFGTGYSSLDHLKRFPINNLKIDRSFVKDIIEDTDNAAIVTAIIAMSRSMGLRVIAEGVETSEQLDFLMELRCNMVQGYLFSLPVPASEIDKLLESSSTKDGSARNKMLVAAS